MIYREVSNSSLKSFLKCRSFGGIGGLQRCPESVEKLVIHADALVVVCCHFSSHRANHIGSSEHYSRDEQLGGAGDGTPNIELIITLISHHIARLKAVIMHSRKGSQASAQTGT